MSDPPIPPPPLPGTPKPIGDDAGIRMLLPVGRSSHAIAAGYLGLLSFIPIFAPFALLFGILAIRDIQKSKDQPHPKHGMGRAIFGIIMGVLGMIALLLIVISMVMD